MVGDYTPDYSGYDTTNTYTPGKTSVEVHKVWDDRDNWDNTRPNSVTVHLLADGVDTGKKIELKARTNWRGIFGDLDAKKGEEAIAYTVMEEPVRSNARLVYTGESP